MFNTRYLHSKKGAVRHKHMGNIKRVYTSDGANTDATETMRGGDHHTIDCHLLAEEIKQG